MSGNAGVLFGWACGAVTATAAAAVVLVWMHRQHKRTEARYRQQAHTDPLTGLPNRSGLHEAVARIAPDHKAAVLLVDLDRFKEINDGLGHDAGDTVLAATASRLRDVVADEVLDGRGTAARMGGDEFVVLLPLGDVPAVEAERLARGAAFQVRRAIARPVLVAAAPVPVSVRASVGAAAGQVRPIGGLLAGADQAMYQAKDLPGGTAYHPPVDVHVGDRPLVRHRELRPDLAASGRHRARRVSGVA